MKINLEEFYSYNSMLSIWIQLHKNYPQLLTLFSIGQSHDNRELICIKLGKGCVGPIMLSGIHGRERTNPIILTAILAKYCAEYYAGTPKFQRFNHECIYFIPLINPDGYEIASFSYQTIRNTVLKARCKAVHLPWYEYKRNARGIDLNRNFSSANFVTTTYSGTPFSEKETKAFRNFCQSHHTTGLIDFHSRGESIYYYRKELSDAYNQRQQDLANELACLTSYQLNAPYEENIDGVSGGNSVNYYSETYCKPAITIETVAESESFPLAIENQSITYQKIKDVPICFLERL